MNDEMEIKVLERFDPFQNDGIHLDGLKKTMKRVQFEYSATKLGVKSRNIPSIFRKFYG